MIYSGQEADFGRGEGIGRGKDNVKIKETSFVTTGLMRMVGSTVFLVGQRLCLSI
jgi:hypothetical protein